MAWPLLRIWTTCVATRSATVECWGDLHGLRYRKTEFHLCALAAAGEVFCWGGNAYDVLGVGSGGPRRSDEALRVSGLSNVSALGTAYNHNCAVVADGSVWCWGMNASDQAGDYGLPADAPEPVRVSDRGRQRDRDRRRG